MSIENEVYDPYVRHHAEQKAKRERLWAMRRAISEKYPDIFEWIASELDKVDGIGNTRIMDWPRPEGT